MKILHAEDDSNDVFIFLWAMRHAGLANVYRCVSDGEKAIEWLSGEGAFADRKEYPLPDLLILDLKMPRRDGFDVLKWCREQKEFQTLPIVILSSSGEARDMKKAYALGATSYFTKSTTFSEVIQYLKQL